MIATFKGYGRIFKAYSGFFYDFMRYIRFAGWSKDLSDDDIRNYHIVKIYHALEKSMSFPNRKASSGWENAFLLLETCQAAQKHGTALFHDEAAVAVLEKFISLPENEVRPEAVEIRAALKKIYPSNTTGSGVLRKSVADLQLGKLQAPEDFFLSRYSLREFCAESVSQELIERAVTLAMKSPSACNRQAWAVYHTADPDIRDRALSFQAGNRGFGDQVPNLLIICADLKAFMPGEEHYQHWIDGGMFSMSIVYALHALGVGSCCLNWSQSPARDKKFRSALNISDNHTVIMMLAVGNPKPISLVCASIRRPIIDVLQPLELAKK
jgi:nitroreductase